MSDIYFFPIFHVWVRDFRRVFVKAIELVSTQHTCVANEILLRYIVIYNEWGKLRREKEKWKLRSQALSMNRLQLWRKLTVSRATCLHISRHTVNINMRFFVSLFVFVTMVFRYREYHRFPSLFSVSVPAVRYKELRYSQKLPSRWYGRLTLSLITRTFRGRRIWASGRHIEIRSLSSYHEK